jgi:hypothetical protein
MRSHWIGLLLLFAAVPLHAAELEVGGFNGAVSPNDPRFDCSRGRFRCRLNVQQFGPFSLRRAEGQFSTGHLDRMMLIVRADRGDVAQWLVRQIGPATKALPENQGMRWIVGDRAGVDIFALPDGTAIHLDFRGDVPPYREACADEDWFEIRPAVPTAAAYQEDGDERC